jgi:CheY-like chemotaxis protein
MKFNNILHIDDDPDDCEIFAEALKEVSSALHTAIHNPVEALIKLDSEKIVPDVIVLDLNMPYMNGMEFLKELKKRSHLKNIPVIMFSTCSVRDVKRRAKEFGAFDYITKPDNYKALRSILQSVL